MVDCNVMYKMFTRGQQLAVNHRKEASWSMEFSSISVLQYFARASYQKNRRYWWRCNSLSVLKLRIVTSRLRIVTLQLLPVIWLNTAVNGGPSRPPQGSISTGWQWLSASGFSDPKRHTLRNVGNAIAAGRSKRNMQCDNSVYLSGQGRSQDTTTTCL